MRNVVPSPSRLDVYVDGQNVGSLDVKSGRGSLLVRSGVPKVKARTSRIQLRLRATSQILLKSVQRRTGNDLFVVQAGSGSLVGERLTLRGVAPSSTYFSDRPKRRAGTFATADLARKWSAVGFASDPPNAAISIANGRKAADTVVVELSRPHYAAGTLSFRARQLSRPSPGLVRMRSRLDPSIPRSFGPAALFIDSDGWQDCNGSLYNQTGNTYTLTSSGTDSHTDWVLGASQPEDVCATQREHARAGVGETPGAAAGLNGP